MRINRLLLALFAFVLAANAARADSLVYIVNGSQQFGTLNLVTGAFQQIGPTQPEAGSFGLARAPNGSLVTFAYSGNLYAINPATGTPTLVGPSGLADCSTPSSPCGPTSASTLGNLGGKIYGTDLQNSLYSIDPVTAAATLIGSTGIPAVPFIPGSMNPDGTFNLYDEAIFGGGGNLYITYDAFVFDFNTFTVISTVVPPELYRINTMTGLATTIGPTDLGIGAVIGVNGTYYAFDDPTYQVTALDLTTATTSFVTYFDPGAGVIQGAVPAPSPVPEPSSITLLGTGLLGIGAYARGKLLRRRGK